MKNKILRLNTSNRGKFEDFKQIFSKYNITLEATHIDLKEIEAEPIEVIAHKASQIEENILVEDTSLEIEGASIGINVRWLLDHLPNYTGCKAEWLTLLAVRSGKEILIYKGSVTGTIVRPRGTEGFGFDPVFLPDGSTKTLAEFKPDELGWPMATRRKP